MDKFICGFDENGILTSLSDPMDTEWKTVFLTSLGEIENTGDAQVSREWNETDDGLAFTITLKNRKTEDIYLDGLRLPVRANTDYVRDKKTTYFQRVMQQACACGSSSFVYWHRPSGEGRFLALLGLDNVSMLEELNTDPWSVRLAPVMIPAGGEKQLKFRLVWMEDHGGIQQILVNNGGVGITFVPGLVIPDGMKLQMRLRSQQSINSVKCDGETVEISRTEDGCICSAEFKSYGEKLIKINYGDNLITTVLCYATKSMQHLIDSSVRHIAEKQRYVGDKWYDGLFSQWSMKSLRMTTPDDTDGLYLYSVSADDPGLCKAPYIA